MNAQSLLGFLREIPLFSVYGDEELLGLLESAEMESVGAGQVIFGQGEEGQKFYVVYNGRVRIVLADESGREVNLGVVAKGGYFGETSLITGKPRNASARAAADSVLLAIDRDAFDTYLLATPEQRELFDKFIRFTSIHRFLKSCTDFSAVPAKDLQELVNNFSAEFYKEGDVVFRQGTEGDKFYLIESGKLKVVRWEEHGTEIINFLREGDFFGEKALIEQTPRHADIVCLTDCHVFSLSREAFELAVEKTPKLRRVIEDRIQSYKSLKPPIPYEEFIKQELAAEKPMEVKEAATAEDVAATPPDGRRAKKKLAAFYHQRVRFPFIQQYDEMTCGTTCLMMISKYYGKTFSSNRLREMAHVDLSGSSLANLASAAEQLGYSTRGMRLDYDTLQAAHLPCIVHWQGYHYVVVYRVTARHVWVADPGKGLRRYKKEDFTNNWNGITLILEPTPEFDHQKGDRSSLKSFAQFVTPCKTLLLEVFIASLLLSLFGLATPIFTQNVVDKVLAHQDVSMLNVMFGGVLLVIIFRFLVGILRQYLIVHTSMKVDLRMLVAFYKHLLALPLGYFKVRKIGDFMARFGENMKIRSFFANTALTLMLDTALITVYVSLMFYYNTQLALLTLLFIPVFVVMTLAFTPILKRLNVDSFAANTEAESHLIESVNAIDTIKAMNIEHQTRWKWEDKFIRALNIDFRLYTATAYFSSLGDCVGALSSATVLWYGARQVMAGGLSVGQLMAFMSLMGSVITPINRIINAWDDLQQTLVSVDRLNDVFTAEPEFPESIDEPAGLVIREPRGEIVFEDVFFRYGGHDDPYILSNINLKIAPGQTVAIVGRSGSGKTTLAKLIAKFYDVTEGRITIDGYDISNINLANLRRFVGLVLQESFVFNGTIRENIALGDPEESMEKVIEAARLANADDFIASLALGYDTKVGEGGLQLSGGQRQRVAIARVLYAAPKILVFDEATSSLDTESEQVVQRNMNAILSDRTAIIIAHRLSTVRNADRIVVLDNGEIVEQGAHEELMDKRGLYHYLSHQQLDL